jgi:hypothetical protein
LLNNKDKTLYLEVIESSSLKVDTRLTINYEGLIGSKRRRTDGCVFFGGYDGKELVLLNNVVIPSSDKGISKRHFVIGQSPKTKIYLLKNLSCTTGTLIKLTTNINDMMLCLGVDIGIERLSDNTSDKEENKLYELLNILD